MRNLTLISLSILCLSACDNKKGQGEVTYDAELDMECARHLYGLDVPQDVEKAIPICLKAAESGAQGSQHAVGMIYIGSNREQEGIYWLKKSAKSGHTGAIEQLAKMGVK